MLINKYNYPLKRTYYICYNNNRNKQNYNLINAKSNKNYFNYNSLNINKTPIIPKIITNISMNIRIIIKIIIYQIHQTMQTNYSKQIRKII